MAEKTWWEAACDLQPDGHVWSSAVSSVKQLLRLEEEIPPTDRCDTPERFMFLCFLALEAGEEIPELWLVDGEVCFVQEDPSCIGCVRYEKQGKTCTMAQLGVNGSKDAIHCLPSRRNDGRSVVFVRAEEA